MLELTGNEAAATGLLATPRTMSKHEAQKLAERKGGLLGKILIRKALASVELLYFPFYLVTMQTGHKLRSSKLPENIKVVVDGSSGKCALVKTEPQLQPLPESAERVDEQFNTQEVIRYATNHANSHLIRVRKNAAFFKNEKVTTFYRPYWVAFYGDRKTEKKVWYLPFVADGYVIS